MGITPPLIDPESPSSKSNSMLELAYIRWFQELSECGLFTTDTCGVIRSWNPWLEQYTGVTARKAVGCSLFELFPDLVERGFDDYYRDALSGQARVLSASLHKHLFAVARALPSGEVTEMAQSVRIAPLSSGEQVVGVITIITDVTERLVAERELRKQITEAERARRVAESASLMKDQFLATLSHEIRTPLSAVLGWTNILRSQDAAPSCRKGLEIIERNAKVQLRLIEDLLDMSRVMSGKLSVDIRPLSFSTVVRAALEAVRPAATAKRITIHQDITEDAPSILADADRLQQAAWNILSNSVKFTRLGGRIEVKLEAVAEYLEFSVQDDGAGITADFLPHVFDRFRQADASAGRRHAGLGLGLALVREIVELHGGSVGAESAGRDQGARVWFRIPVALDRPATATAAKAEPASTVLNGYRLVVVDDDADNREMLASVLRSRGASVTDVGSGADALTVLQERGEQIDVLISDVGMPEMDGLELIRTLRASASPAVARLPAIAVTAYAQAADRAKALALGYQEHFAKPVDEGAVARCIVRLAKRRSA